MESDSFVLADDGIFPNNNRLAVLWYKQAFSGRPPGAAAFEEVFARNGWSGSWRNGVYPYHHYHSTAHEVLGVYSGSASIQLGGDDGVTAHIRTGDVVIIPAGVAHKRLKASEDFAVVGAYPQGQHPDLCRGETGERARTDQNIARVAKPPQDPVTGSKGTLIPLWDK